jgi:hypothetical protein
MAPRKKAKATPFMMGDRPRKAKAKPAPSARPRSAEAKAARMATSRGSSEAQAAAGPRRSRSAEAAAARRSVARRTAAGSEAAQAAMGTGRNRAAEARAATQTPSVKYNKPFVMGDTGVTERQKPTVRNRNTANPYIMGDRGMTRRPSTPFVSYDEAGNLAGPEFTPAQIEAHSKRAWKAEMKRLGINV